MPWAIFDGLPAILSEAESSIAIRCPTASSRYASSLEAALEPSIQPRTAVAHHRADLDQYSLLGLHNQSLPENVGKSDDAIYTTDALHATAVGEVPFQE
ncbi:MAG TPA: hypothetical protein VE291_10465 [Terracidiphilus sp.]|jgi:hypothetical protein|nr:hypothetical protein [Terracidiphilus sp.]